MLRAVRASTRPGTGRVTSLAAAAAMSRSAFAARFTELVGETAMAYVTRWRMHVAADALTSGDDGGGAVRARCDAGPIEECRALSRRC